MRAGTRLSLWTERHRAQVRARRSLSDLRAVTDRTASIQPTDILLCAAIRNEASRLPYLLTYYRALGVQHFLFIDNGSTDDSEQILSGQGDCSLWHTGASYKSSGYGMDWINGILARHGRGHWVLTVDADEFFVYPHMDARPLRALTDWLTASRRRAFGAMLIDLYSDGPIAANACPPGQSPLSVLTHFDSGNYSYRRNAHYRNLWIQGGPRQRVFFADLPGDAPALNKVPLVRWTSRSVYISSTHTLLPRRLNEVYDEKGGEHASGALLHTKFLSDFARKAREEADRGEHYADGWEYRIYVDKLDETANLWTPHSTRYTDWRQLDGLGLISTGDWA